MPDISNITELWDRLKSTTKPIIIYGMGDGAQKILNVMKEKDITPSGFMASDDFVRGHSFQGYEVKKLADIEAQYGDFIVLVAFGTCIPEVMDRIQSISARYELYAPDVPVIGGGLFDKDFYEENAEKIEEVGRLLADDKSKQVFNSWIKYRISGNISELISNQTDKAEAYELLNLSDNETYADLGAYNGDTILEFIINVEGKFNRIYALEPDSRNYTKMKRRLYALNPYQFRSFNAGAWDSDCVMKFVALGGRNSALTPYENKYRGINPGKIKEIEMRALDNAVLSGDKITFIKFDVEGSESKAIDGCKRIIQQDKPKLLVSLYHRTEDIFELPLKIKKLNPSYRFYLRQHPYIPAWDMNLYCI